LSHLGIRCCLDDVDPKTLNIQFLDGKSLYVTACDHVYRIRLEVAGVMPGPAAPAR